MTAIAAAERLRVVLTGAVQGVGFRPFVYRLATELALTGWVRNSGQGLVIEVEGGAEVLREFQRRLETERPRAAVVLANEAVTLAPAGFEVFSIEASQDGIEPSAAVLPDLATCAECLAEVFDAGQRRHLYSFTNCTHCGPRYSIVTGIPYDRPNTTMRGFTLCADCLREYGDPRDRRFHAQPIACPQCGPRLSPRIEEAAEALADGRVVAVKGIGGFQLLCDARNEEAVERLRRRKHREEKPFAMMMPSMEQVRRWCRVSADEEQLLLSAAAPIVLLSPSGSAGLAAGVAKCSPYFGVMLPYSALHHLLLRAFPYPVVATSGNLSDEPIAIDNEEALGRLSEIADLFLLHDRPIARPCDDSVVRVDRGRATILRRARGYAPLPVTVSRDLPAVLAVGGHLKNTVAIARGRQVYLSQHIGDLDTIEARGAFERAIDDLCRLYRFEPEMIACDLHPEYASTVWARGAGLPVVGVQHHHAHLAACAAENDVRGPYLGVAWDGTGYGLDGVVWGGEMFAVEDTRFERVAHLRPFGLPGGEAAVREGWRCAAALREDAGLDAGAYAGVRRVMTTSVGRLFDGVSAMAGVARMNRFEGQAAMLLERSIDGVVTEEAYPLPVDGDWRPLVRAVAEDSGPLPMIAARFHNALVNWIVEVAGRTCLPQVVLSGGTFQNRYLTERAVAKLEARGQRVFTHQRVPPNDGGIALGQAVLAAVTGEPGGSPAAAQKGCPTRPAESAKE